jgi:hypothetical protein
MSSEAKYMWGWKEVSKINYHALWFWYVSEYPEWIILSTNAVYSNGKEDILLSVLFLWCGMSSFPDILVRYCSEKQYIPDRSDEHIRQLVCNISQELSC